MKNFIKDFNFPISVNKRFPNNFLETFIKFIPYFKGSWLLYSPLFSFFPLKNRLVAVDVLLGEKKIFTINFDIGDPYQLNMVKNSCFDLGTVMVIWSLLFEGDTFVDIGANCGYLSQIASNRVGLKGRVVSVEPNPQAFKLLVGRGLKNVIAVNKVAGKDSNSRFTIVKPFYRQSTASRFIIDSKGKTLSISLDDICNNLGKPNIKLIKIDTEGAELYVLEGARNILKEQHPFVIAEVSWYSENFNYKFEAVYNLMKELGYNYIYNINDQTASIHKINTGVDGQILFSVRQLEEIDFMKL